MRFPFKPRVYFTLLFFLFTALWCGCANVRNLYAVMPLYLSPTVFALYLPYLPRSVKVQRDIQYAQVDGKPIKLDIYSPLKTVGKLPVVIWIHGGGWDSLNKSPCPIGCMATQNLAVVSINYRLSGDAIFPAQIYDCKGAVRWLRANADKYNLDADHIGVFGASSGGHLALLLATTAGNPMMEGDVGGNLTFSSRVQCVCAFYPPTDLNRLVADPKYLAGRNGVTAKLIGGAVKENGAKASAASPLAYVDKSCAPVFLMHGSDDRIVSVEQSQIFYEALRKAGGDVQLEVIRGKGHAILAPPLVEDEIRQFFQRHLRQP